MILGTMRHGVMCLILLTVTHAVRGQDRGANEHVLARFAIPAQDQAVLVPVGLGRERYLFLLATGSTITQYDIKLRRYLGKRLGETALATMPGERQVDLFAPPAASLGPLPLVAGPMGVACCDLQMARDLSGTEVYGILGMDILSKYIVRLGFDRAEVVFYERLPPDAGVRAQLYCTQRGLPFVDGAFANTTFRYLVNTGFGELYGLEVPERVFDILEEGGYVKRIAGGAHAPTMEWNDDLGRLDAFTFCADEHRDLIVARSAGALMGLGFLSRYIVTFDFPGKAMYLKKSRRFAEPDLYDLSGINLIRRSQTVIADVQDGSPAAIAGAAAGDLLIRVNGVEVARLGLHQLRRMFSTPGRVELDIRRGDADLRVAFVQTATIGAPIGRDGHPYLPQSAR